MSSGDLFKTMNTNTTISSSYEKHKCIGIPKAFINKVWNEKKLKQLHEPFISQVPRTLYLIYRRLALTQKVRYPAVQAQLELRPVCTGKKYSSLSIDPN